MKYKVIATDLDGTLNNNRSHVSPENIEAIQRAVDSGIKIVICSGRSHVSIANFGAETGLNKKGCYGIAFNGSVVYEADTMKILFEQRLKLEDALYAIGEIKKIVAHPPLLAYVEGNLIVCEDNAEEIVSYAGRSKINHQIISSFEEYLDQDILKLLIHSSNRPMITQIYNGMLDRIENRCSMFFSSPKMLEFSEAASNKATGLKVLADHLGIQMSEIVAVGDNFNDLEMVEQAGLGVAVANGVEALKLAADYVTTADNDHHAIKEVIDYVLGL